MASPRTHLCFLMLFPQPDARESESERRIPVSRPAHVQQLRNILESQRPVVAVGVFQPLHRIGDSSCALTQAQARELAESARDFAQHFDAETWEALQEPHRLSHAGRFACSERKSPWPLRRTHHTRARPCKSSKVMDGRPIRRSSARQRGGRRRRPWPRRGQVPFTGQLARWCTPDRAKACESSQ